MNDGLEQGVASPEPSELNLWARQWRAERIEKARTDYRTREASYACLKDKSTDYALSIKMARDVCAQVLALWEASPPNLTETAAIPPVKAQGEATGAVSHLAELTAELSANAAEACMFGNGANVVLLEDAIIALNLLASGGAPSPVAGAAGTAGEKYDDVLQPFLTLMRKELHANSRKGDRPGWLAMDANTALLEVYWHTAKLSAAVKNNDGPAIMEHSADVANMAMMVLDICGGLAWVAVTAEAPQRNSCDQTDHDSMRCSDCPKRTPRWYVDEAPTPPAAGTVPTEAGGGVGVAPAQPCTYPRCGCGKLDGSPCERKPPAGVAACDKPLEPVDGDACLLQAPSFKLVGKADFHMSAEMDVCIGADLYIRTNGVQAGAPAVPHPCESECAEACAGRARCNDGYCERDDTPEARTCSVAVWLRCQNGECDHGCVLADGVPACAPRLTNDEIHDIFYPMGTGTEDQLLIARSIGRAIERRVRAALGVPACSPGALRCGKTMTQDCVQHGCRHARENAPDGVTAAPVVGSTGADWRHIGYAKYVPHAIAVGGGSSLVFCGPDEAGAFRIFRKLGDRTDGVPASGGGQPK